MCGIVGFNSPAPLNREAAAQFARTLANLESRGESSCGVAVVKGDKVHVRRWLKKSSEVIDEVFELAEGAVMGIGHTRQPSVGPVTLYNAHPLRAGKALVVHNGSIGNYTDFTKEDDPEVDSFALARIFSSGKFKNGLQQLGQLEWSGAFLVLSLDRPYHLLAVAQNSLSLIADRRSGIFWVASGSDYLDGLLKPGKFPGVDLDLWSSQDTYYGSLKTEAILVGPTTVRRLGPPLVKPKVIVTQNITDPRWNDNPRAGTCSICSTYGKSYFFEGMILCRKCYREVSR